MRCANTHQAPKLSLRQPLLPPAHPCHFDSHKPGVVAAEQQRGSSSPTPHPHSPRQMQASYTHSPGLSRQAQMPRPLCLFLCMLTLGSLLLPSPASSFALSGACGGVDLDGSDPLRNNSRKYENCTSCYDMKIMNSGGPAWPLDISGLSRITLVVTSINIEGTDLHDLEGLRSLIRCDSIVIYNNPNLTSLVGLRSLQVTSYVSISYCPALTTLEGLEAAQAVNAIQVSENPALRDISAFRKLRLFDPTSVHFSLGAPICCPSYTFYAATKISYFSVSCVDCFTIVPVVGLTMPTSGDVSFSLGCAGEFAYSVVHLRAVTDDGTVASSVTTCTEQPAQLVCTTPALLPSFLPLPSTPLHIEITLNQYEWKPIDQPIAYVSFAQWANASAITDGESVFSTTPAPGVPDTKQRTDVASATAIMLITVIMSCAGAFLVVGLMLLRCAAARARLHHPLDRIDRLYLMRTRADKLILRESSPEGGLFTGAAVLVALGLLLAYVTQVALDNTAVSMALDPRPTDEVLVTDFEAAVTFSPVRNFVDPSPAFQAAYPGCRGWFDVSAVGFSSQGNASCVFDGAADSVTVTWVCPQCSQELGSGSLSIVAPSANAFTRSLTWRFSSRDYFHTSSTVSGSMRAEAGMYFKGPTLSQAQLVALSTRYTDVALPTRTGKLMTALTAQRGSQVSAATFGSSQVGVGFEFTVQAQAGWFNIILTTKVTTLSVFAQIMAIFGGVWSLCQIGLILYDKIKAACALTQKEKQATQRPKKLHPIQSDSMMGSQRDSTVSMADVSTIAAAASLSAPPRTTGSTIAARPLSSSPAPSPVSPAAAPPSAGGVVAGSSSRRRLAAGGATTGPGSIRLHLHSALAAFGEPDGGAADTVASPSGLNRTGRVHSPYATSAATEMQSMRPPGETSQAL